jgi:peptidoglycan/xylan/chitin deacetylase (PgdA/CDA1 family)
LAISMKRIFFALLHATGATRFAAWLNRRRVIFLCYHGVTERDGRDALDPHGIHVPARLFEQQLDYLSRRHHVVALRDYLAARREGRRLPDYAVVLTFDDGFRNFLTAAAPRLLARRLPASLFIITDHTAGTEETDATEDSHSTTRWSPSDDRTHLSWAEVRKLAREDGFEIGSHTCSHSRLPTLSPAETEREMRDSLASVVARVGSDYAPALSYPKGEYSAVLSRLARTVNYACAVTSNGGANSPQHTDPFALGRTLIGDADDVASFAVRVSGLRDWLVKLCTLFAPRADSHASREPHAAEPIITPEPQQELSGFARQDPIQ